MSTAVTPLAAIAKKSNHQANVVRVAEILKHPNADSLALIHVGGYQVVVKLGQFQAGDLAVYIQPDSVVPPDAEFEFLWAGKGYVLGDFIPEKYRRVTVRKFRKEWSEGLLMPLTDFSEDIAGLGLEEGDDVSDDLDITHYQPPEPLERQAVNQRRLRPKSWLGWFYYILEWLGFRPNGSTGGANEHGPKLGRPVYDVEALKNYRNVFQAGEPVIVTEKIHGSNARYVFEDGKMFVGSRTLWKNPKAKCVWRDAIEQNPDIELWCRAHPSYTLYGEVCPTQGNDFAYGCTPGQVRFFLFDILSPEGTWMPWPKVVQVNEWEAL